MSMFCYQCQETARNKGCTVRGVCGKESEVAVLQDLLIFLLKGIAYHGTKARARGKVDPEADLFVAQALFATITNANFDGDRFVRMIERALALRAGLAALAGSESDTNAPEAATWLPANQARSTYLAKGALVGLLSDSDVGEDIQSLRHLLLFGIKGLAAYTDHAYMLDTENAELLGFIQEVLVATLDDGKTVQDLVALVLRCGEMGVQAMALLDEANTSHFGHPEPTAVNLGVAPGPGILVSGHDLRDLEELLIQTEGTGINVYTHGEMLPAHAYPRLKAYEHLVANYGGSWWHQKREFEQFGGPILMTTNCIIPPSETYLDRLFTTGMAGWPGAHYIPDRLPGKPKDFSSLIAKAHECHEPEQLEDGTITIGFAHNAVASVADKVVEAVKSGAIKRFVVMAGCDGRHKSRQYFSDVAKGLPQDSVILTAGCAKYRYNKLDLGDIGGIPRVLDAGQCNDSYSLVVTALSLVEAFGVESVNDLPIEYDIAWYEQKAVIVLLALLSLGVKRIRLGPTLPAFLSPNVAQLIVDTFDLMPITTAEEDIASIVAG